MVAVEPTLKPIEEDGVADGEERSGRLGTAEPARADEPGAFGALGGADGPLPTDVAPRDDGAGQLDFAGACERVERAVLRQTEHREILIAVLGFCETRRRLDEVELFIMDRPEFGYETQSPFLLIGLLERAGALARLELDENGGPVTDERKEGLSEDEADDLVFEVDYETSPAGREVYGRLAPQARLAELLETQDARRDVYCELLEFCLAPRSREEIEALLEGRDILRFDAPDGRQLMPSVFVDRLERSGVLVWRGKWVTGPEGKAYLDAHAGRDASRAAV